MGYGQTQQILLGDSSYCINDLSSQEKAQFDADFGFIAQENDGLSGVCLGANKIVTARKEMAQMLLQVLMFKFGGCYEGSTTTGCGYLMIPVGALIPECVEIKEKGTQRWFKVRLPRYMAMLIVGEFIPPGREALHFGVGIVKNGRTFPRQFFHTYGTENVRGFSRPVCVLGEEVIEINHDYRKTGIDYVGLVGIAFLQADQLYKAPTLLMEQSSMQFGPVNVEKGPTTVIQNIDNSITNNVDKSINIHDSVVTRSEVGTSLTKSLKPKQS